MFEGFMFTVTDVAYWVQTVSAAIFTYIVLDYRKRDLKKPLKILLEVLFCIAVTVSTNFILMVVSFNYRFLGGVGVWFSVLAGVASFAWIFCKYEHNAKLITGAMTFSTIVIVNEFGTYVASWFQGVDPMYTKIVADLMLIFVGAIMRRYRISRFTVSDGARRVNFAISAVSAIIAIVMSTLLVHLFDFDTHTSAEILVTSVLLGLYFIVAFSYGATYRMCREENQLLDVTAENQMNKAAQNLMAVTANNLEELHKIKHDIENQYAYMRALIDGGDYDGLRDYFDELTGTFHEPLVPMLDCGNTVLNTILNMELAKAEQSGVTLDVRAAPPHELPFRDIDLVKLYTNIIDNAIEACVSEQIEDSRVHITIGVRGDYLFSRVDNPTRKSKDLILRGGTTKANKSAHGKGMTIVRSIIKKYNGNITAKIDNGVFTLELMLDLSWKEDETIG